MTVPCACQARWFVHSPHGLTATGAGEHVGARSASMMAVDKDTALFYSAVPGGNVHNTNIPEGDW